MALEASSFGIVILILLHSLHNPFLVAVIVCLFAYGVEESKRNDCKKYHCQAAGLTGNIDDIVGQTMLWAALTAGVAVVWIWLPCYVFVSFSEFHPRSMDRMKRLHSTLEVIGLRRCEDLGDELDTVCSVQERDKQRMSNY